MRVSAKQREQYREAARIFLDISEIASGKLSSKIACSFIGAYCYALQVPVTVYNISKLPFVGTYKTAKRYCDLMVDAKALEYTDKGAVRITELGNETSDFYFGALFEMPNLVANGSLRTDSNGKGKKRVSRTLVDTYRK